MNLFKQKNPDEDCVDFIKMSEQISRDASNVPAQNACDGPGSKGNEHQANDRAPSKPVEKQSGKDISAEQFFLALFVLYILCEIARVLLDFFKHF